MRQVKYIVQSGNIDNLIPGIKGRRPFPTVNFRDSDPFLMLDHIGPQHVGTDYRLDGEGRDHPHRGFETITFSFESVLNHKDSLGNKVDLNSGDVLRMNAGSGIIHGGGLGADPVTGNFNEVQLWVNNPRIDKMSTPEIELAKNEAIPVISSNNITLRVITGNINGIQGLLHTISDTQIGHLIGKESGEINIENIDASKTVMIYALEGKINIGEHTIKQYELAVLEKNDTVIQLKTDNDAQALVLIGEPLNESVVYGGPFVMNTQEEIDQAYTDYKNGLFNYQ